MKLLPAHLAFLTQTRSTRRNLRSLLILLGMATVLVTVYAVLFHVLMEMEGQSHSWVTGFYWTLVTMSTLGFGDIIFQSDAGRVFSVIVLLSGVMLLLVIIPFTFLQFFYAPWMAAQSQGRTPRYVPEDVVGHVLFSDYDPVAISLIERLEAHGRRYFVLQADSMSALALYDKGVKVVLGPRDDKETYVRVRADTASLVVVTGDDYENTTITFTIREVSETVPIVALARAEESIDILELAGATNVLHLADMLGRSLARRTLGGASRANIIGQFGELLIAEAPVAGTPLVGRTIVESQLREVTGVTVVGAWERGRFTIPRADYTITASTVLVLAGSAEQLSQFDELVLIYNAFSTPVLILGAGRVGRAAAHYLREREIPYRLVDKNPDRVRGESSAVVGSAADIEILERAGIRDAPTTIITTNQDETNIYLTIYCRKLRPNMQIISRATLERNVSTLHRAGADFVMSYASMGASAVFNVLEQNDVVMLAEGLDVFRHPTPTALVGKTLAESQIRETTECSVIALETDGRTEINPDPAAPLPAGSELILIGTTAAERRFLARYKS
ncbi:MAG TPA: NAD-binding protein [Gemmatimonadaceae bacterium]|nr:NAD-binding protein [Gemmatimonadaceae bacterium]